LNANEGEPGKLIDGPNAGLMLKAMADRHKKGCFWDGTAPFCNGRCPNNFKQIKVSKFGDGNVCLTGDKKFCCPK